MPRKTQDLTETDVVLIGALSDVWTLATSTIKACDKITQMLQAGNKDQAYAHAAKALLQLGIKSKAILRQKRQVTEADVKWVNRPKMKNSSAARR